MSDDDPPEEDFDDASGAVDPFDRLDADVERDGDPFERLGDADERPESQERFPTDDVWGPPGEDRRDTADEEEEETGPSSTEPPSSGATGEPAAGPGGPADSTSTDRADGPFADVQTPTESPFDGADSVFERVDSGGADPDAVWAALTGDDDGGDADGEPQVADGDRYAEVSKHAFCKQCEHFSQPPDVACNHHTAEIVEFVDMETVRLADCPVVAEREQLERGE